jgi:hypothetical protein
MAMIGLNLLFVNANNSAVACDPPPAGVRKFPTRNGDPGWRQA